jgi:crossover junction endodeoxyribonuclease RusA
MSVHISVIGTPAAQGSMKHIGGGRLIAMSKKLPAWRKAIVAAAQEATGPEWDPYDGALTIHLDVFLHKPKTTKFRLFPEGPPDLDKLTRGIFDALKVAGTITDDARFVSLHAHKHWATGCEPGAFITIYEKGTPL